MKLHQPLDIALIGTGFRSRTVYRLLFAALHARNVRLVAVCDPVKESADSFACQHGRSGFLLHSRTCACATHGGCHCLHAG